MRETTSAHINGGVIKFRNEWCKCNKRAIGRISESVSNPNRLYFKCEKEVCNFFKFWEPKKSDVCWDAIGGNTFDEIGKHDIIMEVRSLGGGVHTGFQSLQVGFQGLNTVVGGMKMMIMLCFLVSLLCLFALVLIAMK